MLCVTYAQPGSDAAAYGRDTMVRWREWFYKRLRHSMEAVRAVCTNTHNDAREGDGMTANEISGGKAATPACTGTAVVPKSEDVKCHSTGTGPSVGGRATLADSAPRFVAFTGKRQFSMLFQPPLK